MRTLIAALILWLLLRNRGDDGDDRGPRPPEIPPPAGEDSERPKEKEREDASKFAISKFAKDLLEVSDNLRRALEAFPTDLAEAEPQHPRCGRAARHARPALHG